MKPTLACVLFIALAVSSTATQPPTRLLHPFASLLLRPVGARRDRDVVPATQLREADVR